jgi:rod shape-determining protein MreB
MKLPLLARTVPTIGIDLGSSRTRIWVPDEGIILDQATVIAIDTRTNKVVAVGDEAQAMSGRVGTTISIQYPVQKGRLYDLDLAQAMVRIFLQQALQTTTFFRPVMMISVPAAATLADREVTTELLYRSGAREVYTISEPLAAAIGAGVPIADASGSFLVQLGSGIVEGAVISLGSLVKSESLQTGGLDIDRRIQAMLKDEVSLSVSLETAEKLKKQVGSMEIHQHKEMLATGQDVANSSPKEVKITSALLLPVLLQVVGKYELLLKQLLSEIPPELTVDVIDKGMLLSGGLSQLSGLDQYLIKQLGIPVSVVENPDEAAVRGIGTALEHLDLFKESLGYQV